MSDLPYVIVRRTDPTQVRLIGPQHGAWERGYQQGHTDALSRRAPVSLEEIVEVLNLFRLSDEYWRLLDLDRRPDDDTVYSWPVAHWRKVRSLLDRLSNKGEE